MTLKLSLCILLTVNLLFLSYVIYKNDKHDKKLLELETLTTAKIQLFNSASIKQDSSGVVYFVAIPKSINNSNEVWLKLKFKSIKDLKEFQILN